ncbi:MAG TPA: hypothetical protein PKY82_00115 [Pyrinomonadaceae bacterium]|nr:hypothetical protein [Pyrinomonadaceae bacterium]
MFKKYLTLILTVLLINLSLNASIFAETKAEKEAKFAQKVKTQITKLGSGTEAKVEVKLKDGTKLKGYISNIGEESFSVTNDKTGAVSEVPYPNAKQVKGNNLNTGVKIAITVGVIIAIGFILLATGHDN